DVGNRRIVLGYAASPRIESEQHSASPAEPRVSIQVEPPASRGGNRRARIQFPHLSGLRIEQSKDAGSSLAAGPVASVRAEDVVIRGVDPLEREVLDDFAIAAVDFHDAVVDCFPDEALWIDMKIAEAGGIDRAVGIDVELLELFGLRIKARQIVRPIFRQPNDILLVDPNPMSAGQRSWRVRHAVLLHCARARIQLADVRTSVRRIPDVAL